MAKLHGHDFLLLQDKIILNTKVHLCHFSNFVCFLIYININLSISITFSFHLRDKSIKYLFLVSIAYMKFRTSFGENNKSFSVKISENERPDIMRNGRKRRKRRRRKGFTDIIFQVSCICNYGEQAAYFKHIYNRSHLTLININGLNVVFPSRQQLVFLFPPSFSIPIQPMRQSFLLIALSRFPSF